MIWLCLLLPILCLGFFINIYNTLIIKKNEIDNAFAQIDVQLTRRYDLIPNLVEVAKKYLDHEKATLTAVIAARQNAFEALKQGEISTLNKTEHHLQQALGGLYATFENYPTLKADQQLQTLHDEITACENRIAFARQYFNDVVTDYNDYAQQFPHNLLAGIFPPQTLLEIDDIEIKRQAVKVSFN